VPKEMELSSKNAYISSDDINLIERNIKTEDKDKNNKIVMQLFLKHITIQCPIDGQSVCFKKMKYYISFRYNGYVISSYACGDLNKS